LGYPGFTFNDQKEREREREEGEGFSRTICEKLPYLPHLKPFE
jgi:hypothetical protein